MVAHPICVTVDEPLLPSPIFIAVSKAFASISASWQFVGSIMLSTVYVRVKDNSFGEDAIHPSML